MADQWNWAHVTRAGEPTEASAGVSGLLFTAINTNSCSRKAWLSPGEVDDRFAGLPLVPTLRSILESNEVLAEVYQHLPDQRRAEGRLFARVSALLRISKETALDPHDDLSRLPLITRNVLRDPLGATDPSRVGAAPHHRHRPGRQRRTSSPRPAGRHGICQPSNDPCAPDHRRPHARTNTVRDAPRTRHPPMKQP